MWILILVFEIWFLLMNNAFWAFWAFKCSNILNQLCIFCPTIWHYLFVLFMCLTHLAAVCPIHSQKRASCSKSAADLLQIAIIKLISGCVRIACSDLMTTSLLQVVNCRLAASCELQTCSKLSIAY